MKVIPGKMGKREREALMVLLLKKQREQKMVLGMRATTITSASIRKGNFSVLFLFLLFILILFIL